MKVGAALVALGVSFAVVSGCDSSSGGYGSPGGAGGASCASMCRTFADGEACEELDTDVCEADCESFSTQSSLCSEKASVFVACLASADFVCRGPGNALVEGSGGVTEAPAYVSSSQGSLTVEDPECAEKAHDFNDCLAGKVDLSEGYTFEAEGPALSHGTGEEVSDGWRCTPEICSFDHMIYGPYVEPDPGAYRAIFRVKALCDVGTDAIISLDEAATGVYRAVSCSELSSSYGDLVLDFDYLGGQIETRVLYYEIGDVTVDWIRIEPR